MYNIKDEEGNKGSVMNRLPKSFTEIKIQIDAKGLTYVRYNQIRDFVETSKIHGIFEGMKVARIGLMEAIAIQHELNK